VLDAQMAFPPSIAQRSVTAVRRSVQNREFGIAVSHNMGKSSLEHEVLHARLGALKSFLRRSGDGHLGVRLEPNHPSRNYQSGRLAATLEWITEIALLGHRNTKHQVFGNTIHGSTEPLEKRTGTVGRDLEHIANRRPWLKVAFESQLHQIWELLGGSIPPNNVLEEQGFFILGYYQQLANDSMRRLKESNFEKLNPDDESDEDFSGGVGHTEFHDLEFDLEGQEAP
jgi:CRISPR-associated protein (Cas_Csd1)